MSGRGWRGSFRRAALVLAVCLVAVPGALGRQKPRKESPESATSSGRVTSVRFWSLADATRVAVELTGDFGYKSDHLANPERVFFDISGVKPTRVPKGIERLPVNDPRVKQIRIAESEPGTTRIVLDLNLGLEATASKLSNPSRLIIEVRPARPPQPPTVAAIVADVAPLPPAPVPNRSAAVPPPVAVPAASSVAAKPSPERAARPGEPSAAGGADLSASPRGPGEMPATATATPEVPPPTLTRAPEPPPARAAKETATGEKSITRVLGLKLGRVVLDPGHGGHDGGTRGPSSVLEKDLVLDVSKRLGALIQSRMGTEVIFTRDDDIYVPLEERTRIANRHQADLFLSIHANSSPARSASGIETYYLNFTSSKSAMEVAARENASSELSIHDLKDVVQKIALKEKLDESREFADHIQSALSSLSAKTNSRSRNRGVKKAPFVVLIGASMPSVLVEIGFVSNPSDETLMKRPEYRQRIAEALYQGVAQYAGGLSHFEVARHKSTAEKAR